MNVYCTERDNMTTDCDKIIYWLYNNCIFPSKTVLNLYAN